MDPTCRGRSRMLRGSPDAGRTAASSTPRSVASCSEREQAVKTEDDVRLSPRVDRSSWQHLVCAPDARRWAERARRALRVSATGCHGPCTAISFRADRLRGHTRSLRGNDRCPRRRSCSKMSAGCRSIPRANLCGRSTSSTRRQAGRAARERRLGRAIPRTRRRLRPRHGPALPTTVRRAAAFSVPTLRLLSRTASAMFTKAIARRARRPSRRRLDLQGRPRRGRAAGTRVENRAAAPSTSPSTLRSSRRAATAGVFAAPVVGPPRGRVPQAAVADRLLEPGAEETFEIRVHLDPRLFAPDRRYTAEIHRALGRSDRRSGELVVDVAGAAARAPRLR